MRLDDLKKAAKRFEKQSDALMAKLLRRHRCLLRQVAHVVEWGERHAAGQDSADGAAPWPDVDRIADLLERNQQELQRLLRRTARAAGVDLDVEEMVQDLREVGYARNRVAHGRFDEGVHLDPSAPVSEMYWVAAAKADGDETVRLTIAYLQGALDRIDRLEETLERVMSAIGEESPEGIAAEDNTERRRVPDAATDVVGLIGHTAICRSGVDGITYWDFLRSDIRKGTFVPAEAAIELHLSRLPDTGSKTAWLSEAMRRRAQQRRDRSPSGAPFAKVASKPSRTANEKRRSRKKRKRRKR